MTDHSAQKGEELNSCSSKLFIGYQYQKGSKEMLNAETTPALKTPRELRALLRDCGFHVRSRRGNEEIWEHPLQPGFQAVLHVPDLHATHRRHRRQAARDAR